MTDTPSLLTDTERKNRLVVHLAKLEKAGGVIRRQMNFGAYVTMQPGQPSITSNVFFTFFSIAIMVVTQNSLFAIPAFFYLLGWILKVTVKGREYTVWVRIDDAGNVRETLLADE